VGKEGGVSLPAAVRGKRKKEKDFRHGEPLRRRLLFFGGEGRKVLDCAFAGEKGLLFPYPFAR